MVVPPCPPLVSQTYQGGATCSACSDPQTLCNQSSCHQQLIQNLQGAIEIKNTWNIPGCGQKAVLYVSEFAHFPELAIGDYLWNALYGYFEVISFDSTSKKITVTNSCFLQFQNPGLTVPSFSLFNVVPAPNVPISVFTPILLSSFIAPLVNQCVSVTVSSAATLYEGKKIYIGSAIYTVGDITNNQTILICNEGGGFPPGTQIFAFNQARQPLYPIRSAGGGVVEQEVNSIVNHALTSGSPTTSITSTIFLENPTPHPILFQFILLATIQGDMFGGLTQQPHLEFIVDTPNQTDSMGDNVGLPLLAPLGIAQPFLGLSLYADSDSARSWGDHLSKRGYIYLLSNRSVLFTGRLRAQLNTPTLSNFTILRADLNLTVFGVIQ